VELEVVRYDSSITQKKQKVFTALKFAPNNSKQKNVRFLVLHFVHEHNRAHPKKPPIYQSGVILFINRYLFRRINLLTRNYSRTKC